MREAPAPVLGHWRGAETSRDALAFVTAWLVHVCLVARFWFVTDDAYISFRYARNLAEGNGLRYNPGEHLPVEGFSNYPWVALAACVERFGGDPTRVMPAVSALAGSLLLLLVFRALRGPLALSRPVAFGATLVLACCTPFAVWSTGGLETMTFALVLFAAFERLVLARRAHGLAGGLLVLLAALSRQEGVYWGALVLAAAWASRRARREPIARALCVALAVAGLGFALFTAWRLHTYGAFLQSSASAKLAGGLRSDRLARGLRYVAVQHLTTLSLCAIPLGAAAGLARARRPVGAAVLVFALGFPVFAILVSGDFMAFGRFLAPGLAFGALAWGYLLEDVRRAGGRAACTATALGLAVLSLLPAWDLHLVPASVRRALDFRAQLEGIPSEFAYWRRQKLETQRWVQRGRALAQISRPGDSILLSAIGAIGYYSNLFVFDRLGLVTREVALLPPPADISDRMPGHDHPVSFEWFLERGHRPTFLRANFHSAASRAELTEKVALSRRNLAAYALEDEYVLEVYEVVLVARAVEPDGELRYLFVWRALPPGLAPAAAWRDFEQRIAAHAAGGALERVELDLAPDDARSDGEAP